ncbi:MAG: tyrosine--tRNA ligase [Pirellulaceae bacterium]
MHDIFAELSWRGLIHQTTDDDNLQSWLNEKPRTLYAGFDPTAESLHVGSLLPLLMLRRFQRAGHQVIALVGGATGMIGDPSGKSAERNLLDEEQLLANVAGLDRQMRRFLDFDGDNPAVMVNNFDWMKEFGYIEFLRDIGKHLPVNVMMAKDSVKSRLEGESGISYTEFSYMLLQAYDFVHLHRTNGCELQIGGSDQWGNITAGIDLTRRMCGNQVYGITNPLLTTSDGTKMGKTESGAVWISSERTSPWQLWQYLFNTDDKDVAMCLRFMSDLSEAEVTALDQSAEHEAHLRKCQIALADEVTRMVHGDEAVANVHQAREILFGTEIRDMKDIQLKEIFADVPSAEAARSELNGEGFPLVDALVRCELANSKGDARRTIKQGGAYVNNRRVEDADFRLTPESLASESMVVLRSGKKKYALLRLT